MNASPLYNLRILIVEDELGTVATLRYDLEDAFHGCAIDSARNVAEAERKIDNSVNEGKPYDVVVLDFMLPLSDEEPDPEPDYCLGDVARRGSARTLIIYVTAYADDSRFKSFARHGEMSADVGKLCVAKGSGWTQHLIMEIQRNLPAYRIRLRFDSLFRRQGDGALRRAGASRWVSGRSDQRRTLEIAALCSDASRYWEILSPSLKKEIEQVLGHMQDSKGNHFVGFISAGPDKVCDKEKDLSL